MLRSTASKVMWLGRATSAVVGLAILFALAIGVANSALAHTNVDNKLFHLGHSNTVGTATTQGTPTTLVSTLSDAVKSALVVQNKSGGPALSLGVLSGAAPLKVNASAGTATNLSADELDGKDSAEFLGKTEKATDADKLDGLDSSSYLPGGNLPSGQTIRGVYDATFTAEGNGDVSTNAISFAFTLASSPEGHFVRQGDTPPAACPGSVSDPQAAPGHLCVYESFHFRVDGDDTGIAFGASRYGATIKLTASGIGDSTTYGTWAVTAP